jgi:hypothetical protein
LPADTFVISIPDAWTELPTEPHAMVERLREQVMERLPDDARDSIGFRRLLVLCRRVAEQVAQAGFVFATSYCEVIDGAETPGGDDEPYLISVIGWMATKRAADLDAERVTFEALRDAVVRDAGIRSHERVEAPRVVELHHGPAVLELLMREVPSPNSSERVPIFEARFHTLIGAGDGFAVLGFTTLNTELADELVELFHAIASTLEFAAA